MWFVVQIKANKTDFFPLFHAKSLRDKENETLTEIAEIKNMIRKVMGHFEQQVHNENAVMLLSYI